MGVVCASLRVASRCRTLATCASHSRADDRTSIGESCSLCNGFGNGGCDSRVRARQPSWSPIPSNEKIPCLERWRRDTWTLQLQPTPGSAIKRRAVAAREAGRSVHRRNAESAHAHPRNRPVPMRMARDTDSLHHRRRYRRRYRYPSHLRHQCHRAAHPERAHPRGDCRRYRQSRMRRTRTSLRSLRPWHSLAGCATMGREGCCLPPSEGRGCVFFLSTPLSGSFRLPLDIAVA